MIRPRSSAPGEITPAARLAYLDLDRGVSREILAQLDELKPCADHWKILITAGMGFFSDAYDCSSSVWPPP